MAERSSHRGAASAVSRALLAARNPVPPGRRQRGSSAFGRHRVAEDAACRGWARTRCACMQPTPNPEYIVESCCDYLLCCGAFGIVQALGDPDSRLMFKGFLIESVFKVCSRKSTRRLAVRYGELGSVHAGHKLADLDRRLEAEQRQDGKRDEEPHAQGRGHDVCRARHRKLVEELCRPAPEHLARSGIMHGIEVLTLLRCEGELVLAQPLKVTQHTAKVPI